MSGYIPVFILRVQPDWTRVLSVLQTSTCITRHDARAGVPPGALQVCEPHQLGYASPDGWAEAFGGHGVSADVTDLSWKVGPQRKPV